MSTRCQDDFGPQAFCLRVKRPVSDPLKGACEPASACIGRASAASTMSRSPALWSLLLVAFIASSFPHARRGMGRTMTLDGYGVVTAPLRLPLLRVASDAAR